MWLLDTNADSIKLRQFVEPKDYAILSHRWESSDEELLFDEIVQGNFSREKRGFYKISKAIEQAREDDLDFLWIDTCCIDKRSSAELQEAINSMYAYYSQAAVCYVYLRDVHGNGRNEFSEEFFRSEWFQRGWTLQILIAPRKMKFYNAEWQYLGDKGDLSLLLYLASGISTDGFSLNRDIRHYSIAQRMSWAAKRQTTRAEDRAYSLLGIFNVNMPMLYGEGEKAFLRLQQEIINNSDDHSIFAWTDLASRSMLASSPDAFAESHDIDKIERRESYKPYNFSNRGLSIEMELAPYFPDTYLAIINCTRQNSRKTPMGIFIRQLYQDDQYIRVTVYGEHLIDDALQRIQERQCEIRRSAIFICLEPPPRETIDYRRDRFFCIRFEICHYDQDILSRDVARIIWGHTDTLSQTIEKNASSNFMEGFLGQSILTSMIVKAMPSHKRTNCALMAAVITERRLPLTFIMFGFDQNFNPVIVVSNSSELPAWSSVQMDWSDEILIHSIESSDRKADILDQLFCEHSRMNPQISSHAAVNHVDLHEPKGSNGDTWARRVDRVHGIVANLMQSGKSLGYLTVRRTDLSGDLIWKVQLDFAPPLT